jgi:hypothetical protein
VFLRTDNQRPDPQGVTFLKKTGNLVSLSEHNQRVDKGDMKMQYDHKLRKCCLKNAAVASFFVIVSFAIAFMASNVNAARLIDEGGIASPTNVTALIYSPEQHTLVLKNSSSAIVTIDINTLSSTTHSPNWNFTDMAISPSGNYVFAADYGGEDIGYGTPEKQSYVHRLRLSDKTWVTKEAYIAGHIQAVSDNQIILKSLDQWVTFTNNLWGSGGAVVPINTPTYNDEPGYYAWVFEGNFRYDTSSGRLIHGNDGLSSQEIKAFKISGNDFSPQEGSGTYGTAQGYGGSVTLATDNSAFYYGKLQVDALDVSGNIRVFPEIIYAATGHIAFGNGNYYNAHTGDLLGSLGFETTVYALNPDGYDFWVFDASQDMLRHFTLIPATPLVQTSNISSIGSATAVGGGNVIDEGDASVTMRGVCWKKSAKPTLSDSCTYNSSGTGAFTSSITGLEEGSLYHVRAYAKSAMGTGYGADKSFLTWCGSGSARIENASYPTIQEAINHVSPGDIIMINMAVFSEDLLFSTSVPPGGRITLQGGYDCGFDATPGMSVVDSVRVAGAGNVIISDIIIR